MNERRGPTKKTKIILFLLIVFTLVGQFFFLKLGILSPMVKGIEIQVIGGNYIKNIDKYVVKLGDTVTLSAGDYVLVPKFAKRPSIWFNVLDESGVITIDGDKLVANKVGTSSIGVMKKNRVLKKASIKVVNPKVESLDAEFEKPLKFYGDESYINYHVKLKDYESLEKGNKPQYISSNDKIIKVDGEKIKAVGVGTAKVIVKYNKKEVQASFDIMPRVDGIDLNHNLELQVGQRKNLNAKVKYMPKDAKSPKLIYRYAEPRLSKDRNISVDDKGNITGLKIGKERVVVGSGSMRKVAFVNVTKRTPENIEIRNLKFEKSGDKLYKLTWENEPEVDEYFIYKKVQGSDEFIHISTVIPGEPPNDQPKDKAKNIIEYVNVSGSDDVYYVVGRVQGEFTKKSVEVKID